MLPRIFTALAIPLVFAVFACAQSGNPPPESASAAAPAPQPAAEPTAVAESEPAPEPATEDVSAPAESEPPAPDVCSLPPVVGPCKAAFKRFRYDASKGACVHFIYGGCQGNANNFETLEACESACNR